MCYFLYRSEASFPATLLCPSLFLPYASLTIHLLFIPLCFFFMRHSLYRSTTISRPSLTFFYGYIPVSYTSLRLSFYVSLTDLAKINVARKNATINTMRCGQICLTNSKIKVKNISNCNKWNQSRTLNDKNYFNNVNSQRGGAQRINKY